MHARRMTLLIALFAGGCAGLGLWLGTSITADAGSIAVIAAACGVLGSFAPGTFRWLSGATRGHAAGRGRPS